MTPECRTIATRSGSPPPSRLPPLPTDDLLKPREVEILRLLADGMSDRDVAARLNLSAETVRWYNKEIYGKLGVRSRTQAVSRAAALGVLDLPVAAPTGQPEATGGAPAHMRHRQADPAVPRSPIQFVSHEGVSIAWQTIGSGPVDLLFVHGFISHLEIAMEEPEYAAFFDQLGRVARVILFDKRGVGLSDRIKGAPTLEETVGDAIAVLDAARSPRAFVMGTSEGGGASLLLALQHPERVRGLILAGATAKVAREGDAPAWSVPRPAFEARIDALQQSWGQPWSVERFAPSRMHDESFKAWWSRMLRGASSPASVRAVMEVARDVDVRALLPNVRQRTLILHQRDDRIVPVEASRYLAAEIPGARLVELPGGDHIYFVNGAPMVRAVAEFLAEPDESASTETWLAVMLHVRTLAGAPTSEQLAILKGARHRHLRSTPFGWTALFDAPSRAVACSRQLRALGRGRVGGMSLHIGACRVRDGVAVGVAGEVAQQLATLASDAEVIVSATLHDVLVGSDVVLERFAPRQEQGDPTTFGWRLAD